jgi:hypothetical protein
MLYKTLFVLFLSLFFVSLAAFPEEEENSFFYSNVIQIAEESIGLKTVPYIKGINLTSDCIGFVRYVYYRAGLDLVKAYGNGRGGVSSLYDGLKKYDFIYDTRVPRPGDILFFDNTYDINRNKIWDDPLSHIAIVSKIGRHNTIYYVHFGQSGVEEGRINLFYPNTHAFKQKDGSLYIVNSFLRRDRGEGYSKKEYISASFYRAFVHIKIRKKK